MKEMREKDFDLTVTVMYQSINFLVNCIFLNRRYEI